MSDYEKQLSGVLTPHRRVETLVRWWKELNCWGWPKEIPNPEPTKVMDNPWRGAAMKAILIELGRRTVLARRLAGKVKK